MSHSESKKSKKIGIFSTRSGQTFVSSVYSFVYDGNRIISDGQAVYTRAGSARLISERRGNDSRWYHSDGLTSTRTLTNSSQTVTDTFRYDVWGDIAERTGNTPTPHQFVGALGYEREADSGLYFIGTRYYDPSVGRFISQDAAQWGVNWYGYAANNPVSCVDIDGLRPLNQKDINRLHSLPYDEKLRPLVNTAIQQIKNAIDAVPPGKSDPPNLQALWWAIDNLGNTNYGQGGTVSGGGITDFGSGTNKCNRFVGDAYAIGAGLGYGGNGFPCNKTGLGGFLGIGGWYPPAANDLGNPSKNIPNLPLVGCWPKLGDIVAFPSPTGPGHATLYLGGDLLIYAGPNAVKVGTIEVNEAGHGPAVYREYRR